MSYYLQEIQRIKQASYSNTRHLTHVIATRRHIQAHYDKDLNLEALARIRQTSKYHLLRLYKRYYGHSPKQYLTEIRIKKAKQLLSDGHTVTETCFMVGFSSLGSFSTLFKNRVGLSPSKYRKSQLSRSIGG